MWMSKSKVRDDALFSILAELAGPRLHELKPYEAICLAMLQQFTFRAIGVGPG